MQQPAALTSIDLVAVTGGLDMTIRTRSKGFTASVVPRSHPDCIIALENMTTKGVGAIGGGDREYQAARTAAAQAIGACGAGSLQDDDVVLRMMPTPSF